MGVVVGYCVVVGNKVCFCYGVSIFNDGMVVDVGDDLLWQWGDGFISEFVVVVDGWIVWLCWD